MSLLLQALQKAAKSREEGEVDLSSVDALELADELALEPPAASAPRPSQDAVTASAPTSAQAATVLQATSVPAFDPIDYAREHYMLTFVAAAVLLALGYGTYVYLQLNPPFKKSPQPMVVAAPPAAPAPPAGGQPASSSAKISGLPGASAPAPSAATEPPAAATQLATAPTPPDQKVSAQAPAAAVPVMLAESADGQPVARPRAPVKPSRMPVARVRGTEASPPLIDGSDSIETVVVPTSHARQSGESRGGSDIAVRRDGAATVPVDPTVMQAYETLQGGDRVKARALYEQVLQADPRNIDALLGLGTISLNDGRIDDASRHYQRVLELDPRNSYAQAGLISIVGGADLQASESRLKQLIARDPSAFLYFSLGNLYAEQAQWPSAEQAYYQAFQMQSDNPDYAFNLAIGLEHIGQSRLALDYYRKALDLSFKKGHANFDQSLVIQRVGQLSTRVEQ